MNRILTLASAAVVTLTLATGAASAFVKIDGMAESVANAGGGGGGGSASPGLPFNPQLNDAMNYTADEAIQDHIMDHPNIPIIVFKPGKGGTVKATTRDGRVLELALTCKVGSSDRLTLVNVGDSVPAGTKLRWDVRDEDEYGTIRLAEALNRGAKLRIDTGADLTAGAACAARVI